MKKIMFCCFSSLMISVLVACGSIIKDYPAMIMIDGDLYYVSDTAYTGTVSIDAVKTVSSYTDNIPDVDGQCNFDQGLTTKYVKAENGFVVFRDGNWRICNKKASDPEAYRYSFTIYNNPVNSYHPSNTTGSLYYIGRNSFEIVDEQTGIITCAITVDSWDWEPISEKEWSQLFTVLTPDISGIHSPLMLKLSDQYYLFNMDDSIWLGDYSGEKNGMWSIYELKPC